MKQNIYITGLGLYTPLGYGKDSSPLIHFRLGAVSSACHLCHIRAEYKGEESLGGHSSMPYRRIARGFIRSIY